MSSSHRKRPRPSSLDRSVTPPRRKPRVSDQGFHVETHAPPVRQGALRVVSWNVNSVQPLLQKRIAFSADSISGSPLRQTLQRHGWPSFLCLQEVKIAPGDVSSQRRVEQAANEKALAHEPLYNVVFSLPRDKFNATGFGGKVHGVATLFRKELSPLFQTRLPEWDLEGRILFHEFHCGLVVMNGYWVNGTSHPYRNSYTGEVVGSRHDLKLRYHRDILKEVLTYQKEGKPVVLVGDMNVARSRIDGRPNLRISPHQHVKNRQDFNEKFFEDQDGMNGVDIFRKLHGHARKYTWHSTSHPHGTICDRVDYIIVTVDLLDHHDAIIESDIHDNADDKQHSDHVPIFIDLNLAKLSN